MALPTLTLLDSTHGFTAGDLQTNNYVACIAAYQKFYIADGRKATASINTSGFHKLDMLNMKLSGTASGAFTRGEVLTQATSGAQGIFDESVGNNHFVYRTTSVEFDTSHLITGSISGKTLTPSAVLKPPHWLNWIPTQGILPEGGSNAGCLCFGRIFLNSLLNPNQWFASRVGGSSATGMDGALDWLMSQDDLGTPVSSQTSKAGLVGDALVGFIPYEDNYLIFGCASQLWLCRGDPAAGGTMTNITMSTGLFGPQSWCWDNARNLYFVGSNGIYCLPVGQAVSGAAPENLTSTRTPNLIKSLGLNRMTDRVILGYDKDRHGLILSCVQMDGAWSASFWFDLRSPGIFPERYNPNGVPASMLYYDHRRSDYRGLLFGGQDGYIRKFDDAAKDDVNSDDTATAIESRAVLGPIRLTKEAGEEGKLAQLDMKFSSETDGLTCGIHTAEGAERLIEDIKGAASAQFEIDIAEGGSQVTHRPRTRGNVMALKLVNNNANESWAMERIDATILES